MKAQISIALLVFCLFSSASTAAARGFHAFGFSKMRGAELLKESTDLCYNISVKIETTHLKDSTILSELNDKSMQETIDTEIQPALARLDVPVTQCTKELRRSLTTSLLTLSASVKEDRNQAGLYQIVVSSDLGQVVRHRTSDNYARVNVRNHNHVTLSKDPQELFPYVVKQAKHQVEANTKDFIKARTPETN